MVADAASRYPLLGPKHLAPRGLAHSVQEALARLRPALKDSKIVHVHAGTYTSDLKVILQAWVSGNKDDVQAVAPSRKGIPASSDILAVMIPRPEDSPVTLAFYLLSPTTFAILVPNDLLVESFAAKIFPGADSEDLQARFQAAGKVQILVTQMTWVIGNVPEYKSIEMFAQSLRTLAPLTGISGEIPNTSSIVEDTFNESIPTSVDEWIEEQMKDTDFLRSLNSIPGVACRDGLYLYALDNVSPRIFDPRKLVRL
jgi:hypothetical protein